MVTSETASEQTLLLLLVSLAVFSYHLWYSTYSG